MELQWEKKQIPCLKQTVYQVQNQEQTAEVRLPDGYPDMARILCCWGQPVLRGKEWRSDSMGVSGGVMVWVLYAPEDAAEPQVLETWIPFQLKWNHPQSLRDGSIQVSMLLRGLDARALSPRKMMVRCAISALGEGLEPDHAELAIPGEVPDGVQLLKRKYPMMLRLEAGEKTFGLEEDITFSGVKPKKIFACTVSAEVSEEKIVGGRAVFRGQGNVHTVFLGEDENVYSEQIAVPFAQYAELERDVEQGACLQVIPAVSNLEWELAEGTLRLRCGMTAQFCVCREQVLELVEDAYGTQRNAVPILEEFSAPVILDCRREEKIFLAGTDADAMQIVDAVPFMEQPVVRRTESGLDVEVPGMVQMLYKDSNGQYQGWTARFHSQWSIPAAEKSTAFVTITPSGNIEISMAGEKVQLRLPVQVQTVTSTDQSISMVSGITLGDTLEKDPLRPSLILRRIGNASLWDLAKQYGTTVSAIQSANHLQDHPTGNEMLLIPIP